MECKHSFYLFSDKCKPLVVLLLIIFNMLLTIFILAFMVQKVHTDVP